MKNFLKENQWIKRFVKLIIFILIVAYVVSKIHWQDELVLSMPDTAVMSENQGKSAIQSTSIKGEIVGSWVKETVTFRGDDGVEYAVSNKNKQQTLQVGFFTYLKAANVYWLIIGCFMFFIGLLLNALRWQSLVQVQGIAIKYWQALALNWVGLFFNNFLPGQTGGDVAKAYFIARRSPDKKTKAVMSVVVDRLIGLFALMLVGVSSLLLFNAAFQGMVVKLWVWAAVAIVVGLLLLNKQVRKILRVEKLIPKHPKIVDVWQKIYAALLNYWQNKPVLMFAVAISLVSHLVTIAGIYFFSKAIHMSLPLSDFYGLVPMIFLISSIPIAPSGWGIGEALFGNFFSNYASYDMTSVIAKQAMHTQAVAISLLFRLQLTLWSLIGGIFYLRDRHDYERSEKPK